MEKQQHPWPYVDMFDPALNKTARKAQDWDRKYDELDDKGQLNSYQIREAIGERPEVKITKRPEQTGLYVDIEDRAVALYGIMKYLNYANRLRGGKVHTENGGMDMVNRYGEELPRVMRNAENKRDRLIAEFRRGVEVLAATDAMRAYGMDESKVEINTRALQAEINKEFGVGQADAGKRNKAVRTARNLANKVAKRRGI